jgi:hypothetical protein
MVNMFGTSQISGNSNSHLVFEFKGKIKFITVTRNIRLF